MIKMRWVVTDDISTITIDEFDYGHVYLGICGHFQITINQHETGMYLTELQEGLEDILFWINQLFCALKALKNGEDYDMRLLTLVRIKFKFHLEEKLQISCVEAQSDEIEWTEEIEMQEFEEAVQNNRNRLIEYVKKENMELLKSKWMKNLLDE